MLDASSFIAKSIKFNLILIVNRNCWCGQGDWVGKLYLRLDFSCWIINSSSSCFLYFINFLCVLSFHYEFSGFILMHIHILWTFSFWQRLLALYQGRKINYLMMNILLCSILPLTIQLSLQGLQRFYTEHKIKSVGSFIHVLVFCPNELFH